MHNELFFGFVYPDTALFDLMTTDAIDRYLKDNSSSLLLRTQDSERDSLACEHLFQIEVSLK